MKLKNILSRSMGFTAVMLGLYSTMAQASQLPNDVLSQLPNSWKPIYHAIGDLNGDKQNDVAVIAQGGKSIKVDDDAVYPRKLFIFLNQNNAYQQVLETQERLLPTVNVAESCNDELIEGGIEIKKGQLWLDTGWSLNCSTTGNWHKTYQIRYKNQIFSLIGSEYTSHSYDTIDKISTNYLTNKEKVTNMFIGSDKEKSHWEKPKNPPMTLDLRKLTQLP
ncbi:hypothetical protein [Lonepinella sp. BR2474]|uniref:hypothetical protein n=1 Tax=Lonepinella sp. BR2474 TaxID=3434548 RepID=UPI003F6E0F06